MDCSLYTPCIECLYGHLMRPCKVKFIVSRQPLPQYPCGWVRQSFFLTSYSMWLKEGCITREIEQLIMHIGVLCKLIISTCYGQCWTENKVRLGKVRWFSSVPKTDCINYGLPDSCYDRHFLYNTFPITANQIFGVLYQHHYILGWNASTCNSLVPL